MDQLILDDLELDALIASIPDRPITAPLVSTRSRMLTFTGQEDGTDLVDWYTKEEVEFLGGLAVFTWLHEQPDDVPNSIWALFCNCTNHTGWGYSHDHNWWYCYDCSNPRPHYGIMFKCDVCSNWFRPERIPERHFVCQACK